MYSVGPLDEGMSRVPGDFISVLRTAHSLKLRLYLRNFPFNIFGLPLTVITETVESEIRDGVAGGGSGIVFLTYDELSRELYPFVFMTSWSKQFISV